MQTAGARRARSAPPLEADGPFYANGNPGGALAACGQSRVVLINSQGPRSDDKPGRRRVRVADER